MKRWSAIFGVSLFSPLLVYAHLLPGQPMGMVGGFMHPMTGFDHVLVMVAVGLWASQMGGQAVWRIPATFIGFMILGGMLGMAGFRIPFVEQGVLLSVILMGTVLALALKPSSPLSMVIVAVFAVLHGHVHGTEVVGLTGSEIGYVAGFTVATVVLHAVGVALGFVTQKLRKPSLLRLAGGLITLAGVLLVF